MIINLHKKPLDLKEGISIPRVLIEEMDGFVERNALVDFCKSNNHKSHKARDRYLCCPRCLKAFTLIKANEMNLGRETIELLDLWFNCETGHDGYYLDGEGLKDGRISLHRDA